MPCFAVAGRDGVLMPVNKQKTEQREGKDDEKLHHFEHHMAEDDCAVWIFPRRTFVAFLHAI